MSVLLDIDLDWLNMCSNHDGSGFLKNRTPQEAFDNLISRVNPNVKITMSVEHHEAYQIWDAFVDEGRLTKPKHIYHVDEHHDLYNDYEHVDCANFMLFALRQWPKCKATWIAADSSFDNRIHFYYGYHQSEIKKRFKTTLKVPNNMRDVDLISITVSPDYIKPFILEAILPHIEKYYGHRIIGQFPTLRKGKRGWTEDRYPCSWTMRHVRRT